jgi:hypothetical protein
MNNDDAKDKETKCTGNGANVPPPSTFGSPDAQNTNRGTDGSTAQGNASDQPVLQPIMDSDFRIALRRVYGLFSYLRARQPPSWQASFSGVLILNAAIQIYFLSGQFSLSKKALEDVQRAFVTVNSPGSVAGTADGLQFHIQWENNGTTLPLHETLRRQSSQSGDPTRLARPVR